MLDREKWMEIFQSIRKHKLRTFLTGFGVAWGIFMLVILLCVGKGFEHGVINQFSGSSEKSIQVWGGITSVPYKGLPINRYIRCTSEDLNQIRATIPEVAHISPEVELDNPGMIIHGKNSGNFSIVGIYPEFTKIKYLNIQEGRGINPIDYQQQRKVAVIGSKSKKQLFKDKNPIGESINIRGNYFMVIGVVAIDTTKIFNFGAEKNIYIPYSTYKQTFTAEDYVQQFNAVAGEGSSATEIEWKIRHYLAKKYIFDPEDNRAVWIQNNESSMKATSTLFTGLNIFLWIIGISTLVGGIVGVGNIMMVTVKERTKEIGIRKALGAIPSSITGLVIQESIVITTLSGLVGLILASGVLEVVGYFTRGVAYFQHPQIDLNLSFSALGILVIAGALAGYIPARNASKVSPIEALRYE